MSPSRRYNGRSPSGPGGDTTDGGGKVIHYYNSTSEAYDDTQTNEDISVGDTLVVVSERVVGVLIEAWPTAVTIKRGAFHKFVDMAGDDAMFQRYSRDILRAMELAVSLHKSDWALDNPKLFAQMTGVDAKTPVDVTDGRGGSRMDGPLVRDEEPSDYDRTHCKHGTYIGWPGGPDYMCGYCESGE